VERVAAYADFLDRKSQLRGDSGFVPLWTPGFLFDFQRTLVDWAIRRGKAAIFADCGMGKTPMQLVYAENVVRKTGGRVLIITPLAVSAQTLREAAKFGIRAGRELSESVVVTNYEKLHLFNPDDFAGVVLDESSAIKHFTGKRQRAVTQFMLKIPYRLLCTATAAPNDYVELGTSSEALGEMGRMDMLGTFFRSLQDTLHAADKYGDFWNSQKFALKPHAEESFWRWVCSWARAIRRPSDLGFDDGAFVLPPLETTEHIVKAGRECGELWNRPATTLAEQRDERRATLEERCRKVAELVSGKEPAVVWCHLNDEGDRLEELIKGARQVHGGETDDDKEAAFLGFSNGDFRVLITKPRIGAFGLNWQHCSRMTFFPSHSFEQFYQGVRRCWRFGQKKAVHVDVVTTEGEMGVLKNLQRKAAAAELMFDRLVQHMGSALEMRRHQHSEARVEVPSWL